MNKICVVAKNKDTYFIKRLIEEVGKRCELFNPWADLEFPVADIYLSRCTGVYKSDLDLLFLKTVAKDKLVNNFEVLNLFRSKITQYEWFEKEDLPSLPWLPIKGSDILTIEKFFRLYPELVVKPFLGQGGWGVQKLTWPEFNSWKKKNSPDENYLLQPLIRDGKEFRYFFIKGKTPIILERRAKSGIAANFQNQGEGLVSNLPDQILEKITKLVNLSTAHYGAIDLFMKDDRMYILELNSVPGIEQLEKISGKNIIKEILESLTLLNS